MMRADESGKAGAVRALRDAVLKPSLEQHKGRLVKLMGDGVNIAARREGIADQGKIFMSRQVAKMAQEKLPQVSSIKA